MKNLFAIIFLLLSSTLFGQSQTKRVLFLGNSYTYVNNLPQMISDAANSTGDTLIFDSNAPGGYTLQQHSVDATSLSKIAVGNWDDVVLQEQSQMPSFPISQVETDVFPYAHNLDSIIHSENSCAETIFYMTWGRKNGDASNCATWPPVCTYSGMDSLLRLRYMMMADSNNAVVSPVGAVRNYLRQNFPLIELYQTDESHPSVEGTYAAACCFYATIYRKDPTLITFNSTILAADAANIRNAAKLVVYDSLLNWHIGEYDPFANFNYTSNGTQITFTNTSSNSVNYEWNFGDGDTSSSPNPVHTYIGGGSYTVMLIAAKCGKSDTLIQTINVSALGIFQPKTNTDLEWNILPNPVTSFLTINTDVTGTLNFKIYNVLGEEMMGGEITNANKPVDVSVLPKGIYFLQLRDSYQTFGQRKFVTVRK